MDNQKGWKGDRDKSAKGLGSPSSGKAKGKTCPSKDRSRGPTNKELTSKSYKSPRNSPSSQKEPEYLRISNHTTFPTRDRESEQLLYLKFKNSTAFLRVVGLKDFDKTVQGRQLIRETLIPIDYIHLRGYIPFSYTPLNWHQHEGYLTKDIPIQKSHRTFQIQWFNLTRVIPFDTKDESFQDKMEFLFFEHLKAQKSKIFEIGIPLEAGEVYWNAGVLGFCVLNNRPQFLMGERHKKWHFVGGGCVDLGTDANLIETALREWNEETYGYFERVKEDIRNQIETKRAFLLKCPQNHFIGWIVRVPEVNVSSLGALAVRWGLPKEDNEELFFGLNSPQRYAREFSNFALNDISAISKLPSMEEKQQEVWNLHYQKIEEWIYIVNIA